MPDKPKMVTLLPSSDVDLGRWLMQLWGRPYHESPHAPVFHILALKYHGVGKNGYPLLLEGDKKLAGIEELVAFMDPLAPAEARVLPDKETEPELHQKVMALQHDFRFGMGNGTVHWAYYNFLQHKDLVWPSITTGVPWFETGFLTFGFGLIKRLMFKGLNLSEADSLRALDVVRKAWDDNDARLADGRQYLLGDRLTLADLAFAASGGPMVLARGYGGHLPPIEDVPPNMHEVMSELRARPSGAFIQRIYDTHRLTSG